MRTPKINILSKSSIFRGERLELAFGVFCILVLPGCGKIWENINYQIPPTVCNSTYSAQVLIDNPAGYWRLNEPAGLTAFDLGTGGNNAPYAGGVTLGQAPAITGLFNFSVLQSTAATSVAFLAVEPTVTILTNNILTQEMWVKQSVASVPIATALVNGGYFKGFIFGLNTFPCAIGQFKLTKFGAGPDICVNGWINDVNVWHYLAIVADNTGMVVYVDGQIVGTSADTNNYVNCDATCSLGIGYNSGGSMPYNMEEVAIYTTALTQARIQSHYQAGITCH
jgi:hypothetical protein